MGESSVSENKNVFSSDLKTFPVFAVDSTVLGRWRWRPCLLPSNNNNGFKSLFQNCSNDLQNVFSQIFNIGESSFSENKNVLSSDLKTSTVFAFFIWMGSRFHSFGLMTRKVLSPAVFSLDRGMFKSIWHSDHRRRCLMQGSSRLERYAGTRLCCDLNTYRSILYRILANK